MSTSTFRGSGVIINLVLETEPGKYNRNTCCDANTTTHLLSSYNIRNWIEVLQSKAVPTFLYRSEVWTLKKHNLSETEAAEVKLLRQV